MQLIKFISTFIYAIDLITSLQIASETLVKRIVNVTVNNN